ncbi:hypothetical protein SeMB42_g00248 [Synchytrium endobioticum]|uniref:Transmembrane protein n=1 Tax=Synchytrium endobioticum TaxID=286115 RepID=A0A507DTB6_9FUNG|nr:hypothetical protein SeLEV6574_g06711 [Synchytrium endobioticum]TPX54457.1 hypothetical protein SeMB42_g00248 [Synchytrium endobioticum]
MSSKLGQPSSIRLICTSSISLIPSAYPKIISSSAPSAHRINEALLPSTSLYTHPNSATLRKSYYFASLVLVFFSVFGALQATSYEKQRKQMMGHRIEHRLASQSELDEAESREKGVPYIIAGVCMLVGVLPLCAVHRVNAKTIQSISTLSPSQVRITTPSILGRSTIIAPLDRCSINAPARTNYGDNNAQVYIPIQTNVLLLPVTLFRSGYLKLSIQGRWRTRTYKVDRMGNFPNLDAFDQMFYWDKIKRLKD